MRENSNDLMKKIFYLEGLLHRYHGYNFRTYGPIGNPLKGQGRILSILKLQPEISQKDLSYLLDMRQQSLSELLKKLELKGFITRNPSKEDRRVIIITLTDEGKNATPDAEENILDSNKIFDCLNDEEQEAFEKYVDRLTNSIEQKLIDMGFSSHHHHHHDDEHDLHHFLKHLSHHMERGTRHYEYENNNKNIDDFDKDNK